MSQQQNSFMMTSRQTFNINIEISTSTNSSEKFQKEISIIISTFFATIMILNSTIQMTIKRTIQTVVVLILQNLFHETKNSSKSFDFIESSNSAEMNETN